MTKPNARQKDQFSGGTASHRGHDPGTGIWLIRRHAATPSLDLDGNNKLELQTYVCNKLYELRTLPQGWDGAEGGPTPQPATHLAYRILDRLSDYRTIFPFITPGEDGEVVLEWRAGAELLELTFPPEERPYVYYKDPSGSLQLSGELGTEGVGYEVVRKLLAALSRRVWSENPTWKRLFS
ncbi:hypothetical protein ABT160_25855 [Streptomyces sp. NPDC001941]|uniref:hypothetical protein n=1 Tax=Streptomyces sp. NPDC001941 TaxID=3154659 RepID=UPI0033254DCA